MDPWRDYCSFYERDFERQMEYNEKMLKEQLESWKRTGVSKFLAPKEVKGIEDIPITSYRSYPMMREFGMKVEAKVKEMEDRWGGSSLELYLHVANRLFNPREYGLMGDAAICKTSGTSGESKYIVHSMKFIENLWRDSVASGFLSGSFEWGRTELKEGDTVLNIVAPLPYVTGWGMLGVSKVFRPLPSMELNESVKDMQFKFFYVLREIEKGRKVDAAGGIASMFYLFCRYFSDKKAFLKEYMESIGFGVRKLLLFFKWLQSLPSKNVKRLAELLPVKGMASSGIDTKLYNSYFREQFGFEPLNVYGCTELGVAMMGMPDDRGRLFPNLRSVYLEFLDRDGEMVGIREVKKGKAYSIVGTPFGSNIIRYRVGDLVKVVDIRDDGMPIFSFSGREVNFVELYGYVRLFEADIVDALHRAGLLLSDKWAVTKEFEPYEHIYVVMEKEWEEDEEEIGKRIFKALLETSEEFRKFVRDFHIKDAKKAIRVEYLKRGAFLRYTVKKAKEGAPMGQIKPPKIVPIEDREVIELLKSV